VRAPRSMIPAQCSAAAAYSGTQTRSTPLGMPGLGRDTRLKPGRDTGNQGASSHLRHLELRHGGVKPQVRAHHTHQRPAAVRVPTAPLPRRSCRPCTARLVTIRRWGCCSWAEPSAGSSGGGGSCLRRSSTVGGYCGCEPEQARHRPILARDRLAPQRAAHACAQRGVGRSSVMTRVRR
jgi:hypothetical protein